jgi:hypothetical protein
MTPDVRGTHRAWQTELLNRSVELIATDTAVGGVVYSQCKQVYTHHRHTISGDIPAGGEPLERLLP